MATCLNSKRILRPARMLNNITLVDVMCPVCRGIFIEPVTLPCHHGLCLKCFERSMEESSLACPMCRKRVGSWLRTATKDGNLVNIKLWALIQQRFPKEVQAKMNGEDDGVEDRVVNSSTPRLRLSSPGEIGQEFAFQLQQLQEEAKRRQEAEWRASCELIRKLHEEEKEQRQREQQQQLQDEQMARQLHSTIMQSSSIAPSNNIQQQQPPPQQQLQKQPLKQPPQQPPQQSSSFSDIEVKKGPLDYFFSSGNFHKKIIEASRATDTPECSSEQARSSSNLSTGSQDSITQEMLHFKPIKVVPRTPPKRLPGAVVFADGQVVEPRLVKATPLNLNRTYEALEGADVEALLSPASRLRLSLCQQECTLPQPSAFRASARALNAVCAAGYPCMGVGGTRSSVGLEEAETETPTKRPRLAPQHPEQQQRRPGDPQPDSTEESSAETPASPAHTDATEADINMGVLRLSPASGPLASGSAGSSHSADLHTKVGFLNIVPGDEAASSSAEAASSVSSAASAASAESEPSKGGGSRQSSLMEVDGTAPSPRAMDVEEEELDDVQEGEEQGQRHAAALLLLAQEQARAEALLRQERADLELARRLQSEWELADQRIDRSRGSDNPYGLRRKSAAATSDSPAIATASCSGSTAPSAARPGKGGRGIRQRTLEETLTPRRRSGRN